MVESYVPGRRWNMDWIPIHLNQECSLLARS